jgi:hypothetical protein
VQARRVVDDRVVLEASTASLRTPLVQAPMSAVTEPALEAYRQLLLRLAR